MPTYPHRIRLRGPWECEPLTSRGGERLPEQRRVTMPGRLADLGLGGFAGQVRFVRKFGYPGRIDDFERVWLTCAGLEGTAEIRLNDHPLAREHTGPFAFDVTPLLRAHNSLEITLHADSDQAGLWGEVALEIRCTAYLDDLSVRPLPDGHIEITGAVVGACDGPLELYAILDGAQAHYERIDAAPAGRRFRFLIPPPETPAQRLRLELVNVSTVWYSWDLDFSPLPFGEKGRG